jgi:hypothetical protein
MCCHCHVSSDCPTREKHAWLGDAMDVAEEAFYNFWSVPVFEMFLDTIRSEQVLDRGSKADGNLPMNVPAVRCCSLYNSYAVISSHLISSRLSEVYIIAMQSYHLISSRLSVRFCSAFPFTFSSILREEFTYHDEKRSVNE